MSHDQISPLNFLDRKHEANIIILVVSTFIFAGVMMPWKGFSGYMDIGQKLKAIRDIFVNI